MYKKGITMRDLMAPVFPLVPQASVTPEPYDPNCVAYEYREKRGIRSDPFMRQVFSNERGMNPLQRVAWIVALCGIAGLAVWTIAAVLDPESRGYNDAASIGYDRTENNNRAEAHSSFRAVPAGPDLKPEQILYSGPSTP